MKFVIDIPNDMLSHDEKDWTNPEAMRRILRSHIAHLGHITIERMYEGGPKDTMHTLKKIEQRLDDPEHYKRLLCNCASAEASQRGLYKRWTCFIHGEQYRSYE